MKKRLVRMDKFVRMQRLKIKLHNPAYKAMQENKPREHGYFLDDFVMAHDIDPYTWEKIIPVNKKVQKQKLYIRGDMSSKLLIPFSKH